MNAIQSLIRRFGLQIAGIALFLLLIEILSFAMGANKIPRLETLASVFFEYLYECRKLRIQGGGSDGIGPHLFYTVTRTLLGAAVGLTAGVALGLGISRNAKVRAFSKYLVSGLRIVPPLVVIPFFLMWFGPTMLAQFIMIVFYCASMMIVTTTTAVSNVDAVYVNYGYTLGADKARIFNTIILPMIVPELIGGLRVALGASWGIQVVTELMGSRLGMGQVFMMMISMQAIDIIIVGILWIAFFAVAVDALIQRAAGFVTSWTDTSR